MEILRALLGPSPKTTIGGIIGAAGMALTAGGTHYPVLFVVGPVVAAIGAAWAGRTAGDDSKGTAK